MADLGKLFSSMRRRKSVATVGASGHLAGPVSESEDNAFSASMGFGFKCGVCGKDHKSSLLSKVKSVALCIQKIVRRVGGYSYRRGAKGRSVKVYGDRAPSYGMSVRFLPSPEEAETIRFGYRDTTAFAKIRPQSLAFTTLHPKLNEKFGEFQETLERTLGREYVEELSVREALGSEGTLTFVEKRLSAFEGRALAEAERLRIEQEATDPKMFALARNWRAIRPERLKIAKIERGGGDVCKWFQKRPPDIEPIKRLTVNGTHLNADTILGWFDTVGGAPVWDAYRTSEAERVVFDVDVIDGFPRISWGIVGAREIKRRRGPSEYKGLTILHFVSTWDGKTYLDLVGKRGDYAISPLDSNYALLTPVGEEAVERADAE